MSGVKFLFFVQFINFIIVRLLVKFDTEKEFNLFLILK